MLKFMPSAASRWAASDHSNFNCPERSANTWSLPSPVMPSTAAAPSEVIHCARAMAKLQGPSVRSMELGTDCETTSMALPCNA